LQDLARPAGRVVINESTLQALGTPRESVDLGDVPVKGRNAPVHCYRIDVIEEGEGA
jgi:class 3 adenylate cyclase